PTGRRAIASLAVATPVLHDARLLLRDLAPGVRLIPTAATRLHSALHRGIPVLRRAPSRLDGLNDTVGSVNSLAGDPTTPDGVRRLLATLRLAGPLVQYLAPAQLKCNYIGLYWRNISSTLSEGDASGNWVRTLAF